MNDQWWQGKEVSEDQAFAAREEHYLDEHVDDDYSDDETPSYGPSADSSPRHEAPEVDEGDAARERIAERVERERRKGLLKAEREKQEALDLAEEEEVESEWEAEVAEINEDNDYDEETLTEYLGKYSELSKNPEMWRRIIDKVDIKISEGASRLNPETYDEAVAEVRKEDKLAEDETYESHLKNERVKEGILARQARQRLADNAEAEAAVEGKEPRGEKAIIERFQREYSDVCEDPEALRQAIGLVDREQGRRFVGTGEAVNDWSVYEQAGQKARHSLNIRQTRGQ